MKKWDWDYFWIVFIVLMFFFFSFSLGYSSGKDTTSFSFEGLPVDAVIHYEVDKGGLE